MPAASAQPLRDTGRTFVELGVGTPAIAGGEHLDRARSVDDCNLAGMPYVVHAIRLNDRCIRVCVFHEKLRRLPRCPLILPK
jgi:hypothetical protein